jgi:hypothetical protein
VQIFLVEPYLKVEDQPLLVLVVLVASSFDSVAVEPVHQHFAEVELGAFRDSSEAYPFHLVAAVVLVAFPFRVVAEPVVA